LALINTGALLVDEVDQRRFTLGADTARLSGNDDVPWQQGNSRPRTETLTRPVRLRAGTTALRRFVQKAGKPQAF
jgi:transposase